MHNTKHLFSIDLFPDFFFMGIKSINGEATSGDSIKNARGIELGLLFVVITYVYLS